MQKRVNLGTSIMENCIIIGLVALTSIGILTTFGGTISETLGNCNVKFKEFQPFGESATASNSEDIIGDPVNGDLDPIDDGLSTPSGNLGADPDPVDIGVVPIIQPVDPNINPVDPNINPVDPGIGDTASPQGAATAVGG